MKYFILFLFVFLFIQLAYSSSVTKTVGISIVCNYPTIADALADINTNGLADSVSLMLMDSIYNESTLIYNPTTSQPNSMYMYQGGSTKPHVHVSGGGFPYAFMAMNRTEFVMYNIIVEPDTTISWLAGVNIRSQQNNSLVYIQSGGVIGYSTQRGYDVMADSSSTINIFGCLVLNVQSIGIYVELQSFAITSSVKKLSSFNQVSASGVKIKDGYISGADTAISINGIGKVFTSTNTVITQCNVGTSINSMADGAEIRFIGGVDTVASKSIHIPNGHNVSVFEAGDVSLLESVTGKIGRRAIVSMLKFSSAKSLSSGNVPVSYDLTINNDSTVPCILNIIGNDFDWIGEAILVGGGFGGRTAITDNNIDLNGSGYSAMQLKSKRSELPTNVSGKISLFDNFIENADTAFFFECQPVVAEDSVVINNNTITDCPTGIAIELNNDTAGITPLPLEIFPFFDLSNNIISVSSTSSLSNFEAMQLRAKRSELPTRVRSIYLGGNTINGNTMMSGIGLSLVNLDAINGAIIKNNTIGDVYTAFQYRAKRSELPAMSNSFISPVQSLILNGLTTAEITTNTFSGVRTAIDMEFNPDSLLNTTNSLFPPVEIHGNVFSNTTKDPGFTAMQLRAQRTEVAPNIDGIIISGNTFEGGGSFLPPFLFDANIVPGYVQVDSNIITDYTGNVALQLKSKRAEIAPSSFSWNTLTTVNNISIDVENTEFSMVGNISTGGELVNSKTNLLAGNKYEISVRKSKTYQLATKYSTNDTLKVTITNNTFTNFQNITIDAANDDTAGAMKIFIEENTVYGASLINTLGSTLTHRYELRIRYQPKAKAVSAFSGVNSPAEAITPGELWLLNNTFTNIDGGITIDVEDANLHMTGNQSSGGIYTSSPSKMPAGNKYEIAVRKSKNFQLFANNRTTLSGGSDDLDYTNNTVTSFGEVLLSLDDASGTVSALVTGNTFTGIGGEQTTGGASMLAGNKYEVAVRKSKNYQLALNNASNAGSSSFDYTNNIVTGYPDVSVSLDDSSGTMASSIRDNTFIGTGILQTNGGTSMLAGNKYEIAVRKSKNYQLANNNTGLRSLKNSPLMTAGNKYEVSVRKSKNYQTATNYSISSGESRGVGVHEWFIYQNNSISGFSDGGLIDLSNDGDIGTARIEENTFGTPNIALKHQGKVKATENKNNSTIEQNNRSFLSGKDSLIVKNNFFNKLDGGGVYISTENYVENDTMEISVDGNSLSSEGNLGILSLSEAEFDSGHVHFTIIGNTLKRLKAEIYCENIDFKQTESLPISSSPIPPNTFTDGNGIAFYRNPASPITFNYQNVMRNYLNIFNGTGSQIDARYCWWGTTDSADIASKMQGNVLFMPFLTDSVVSTIGSIVGRVYLDADASYSYDSGEMLLQWQEVTLWQNNSLVGADTTDVSGMYSFSNLTLGSYTVRLTPLNGYVGTENDDSVVVDFVNGNSPIENFGIYQELQRFRTFKADTLLTKKSVKMTFKNGVLTSAYPNTTTALENVFARLGKNGATFLGVPQSNKNRAKLFAWVAYTKAADLGKLFLSAHTGTSYPIDSLRPAGKKAKFLKGTLKADRKTYNNAAWEQGVAFNLNVIASALGVTPQGFGDLVVDSSFMLGGRDIQGMTLSEVSAWMNSLMTYWDSLGVDNSTAYAELGSFATNFLKRLNDGFSSNVTVGNSAIDTAAVLVDDIYIPGTKKNPYAVTLNGVATASSVGLVKYVPGNTPAVVIQDAGYSEESEVPNSFGLMQNYPNPFNPSTVISYSLPIDGIVTLKIYDVLGREVATVLQNATMEMGNYQTTFNATSLTSGVYFYRINVESVDDDGIQNTFTDVKRMLLIK